MKREEKLDVLLEAMCVGPRDTDALLDAIEAQGYTIYKKKVSHVKRRPVASSTMTPKLRAAIRATHKALPHALN